MTISLAALAELVGGTVVGSSAAGQLAIHAAATLAGAEPGQISLLDSAEKAKLLTGTRASAIVVPRGFAPEQIPAVQVDDVHAAFAAIVSQFRPVRSQRRTGISPHAFVSPTAQIGDGVEIGPGATIGDDVAIGDHSTIHPGVQIAAGCQIGRGVTIFPNAVLYENTVVGDRSIIHAAAVLGAYGFGYKRVGDHYQLSSQLGYVELGCDVEIGAGTTIDRGTYSATLIGEGTKIDNQVMIGHNCRIGRHNMICSQVGIAGSTSTCDYVVMAGQVGVRDHVHIGSRAVLARQAGVSADVDEGAQMLGSPAKPMREQMQNWAMQARLPEMRSQLRQLQRQVNSLLTDETDATGEAPHGDQAAA